MTAPAQTTIVSSGSRVHGQCRALPPRARKSSRPLAEWRRARAVELATQGYTYQQIADELGYANRGTVHRVVQQTLQAVQTENVAALRAVEVDRFDALQQALWGLLTVTVASGARPAQVLVDARDELVWLDWPCWSCARQCRACPRLSVKPIAPESPWGTCVVPLGATQPSMRLP